MIRACVETIRDLYHGIRILRLRPEGDFSWKAGQYAEITFGNHTPRPYSIANAPSDTMEVHVKDSGAGGASTYAVKMLKPLETVRLGRAAGNSFFENKRDGNRPLLLIGGGLGVAPMKAIAEKALLKTKTAQPVYLYWGARHAAELYIADYFHGLAHTHGNFHFVPVIGGMVGESAAAAFDSLMGFSIFLAGPPAMTTATIPLLLQKGAERAHIHRDEFTGTAGAA